METSSQQKQLNLNVIEQMKANGTFYELHARLLTNIAQEAHNEDIEELKPYKQLRTGVEYQVAQDIVIRYLKYWKLDHTLQTIQAESDGKLKFSGNERFAEDQLDLEDSDDPLGDLMNDFIKELNGGAFYANRDQLRENLIQRINSVIKKK